MLNTDVVIIGGGATGAGILRDLSMRGIKAILVERGDLGCGTSSRFHGLLHSGARYAVKDKHAAIECIEENKILRKIGKHCVEPINSIFIRTPEDDEDYEDIWLKSCAEAGIDTKRIELADLFEIEPNVSRKVQSAFMCPGAAIDSFRLLWQIFDSAKNYGGKTITYHKVISIDSTGGRVHGVTIEDVRNHEIKKISCSYVISAAGPWCGEVAALAGLKIKVSPSKGSLIAFNHRICHNVIHRLHKPADADIFVPHGTVTILGTTSVNSTPDDNSTKQEEVESMLKIGTATFENLYDYRILRVFAGCRPLYSADEKVSGRNASRDFVALDHEKEGLSGFMSVCGGKFTTHRLMAQKVCDIVAPKLGCQKHCQTSEIPLIEEPDSDLEKRAKAVFPNYGSKLCQDRQGPKRFEKIINNIEKNPEKGELICECENVTRAEVEAVASEPTTHSISDVRRRTRLGMGTCQGTFCTYRAVGTVKRLNLDWADDTSTLFKEFLEARWKGIRPVMWGNQMRDVELARGIYEVSLNINHKEKGNE